MRNYFRASVVVFVIALTAGLWLSRPQFIDAADLPEHTADAQAGERIFWAGGCASCHASPVDGKRAKGDNKLLLGGGLALETPYGVFRVPNISPHEGDGIGRWSRIDFINAMQRGLSPRGQHYYPSFPYTSYAKMPVADVIDLKAYLDNLPAVAGRIAAHELKFPWNIRRGIGLWKRRYLSDAPVVAFVDPDALLQRGRQLVEGAGHCGECHSPRDAFGGIDVARWLGGAAELEGEGSVPNITPGGKSIGEWAKADIAYYLESGFTPEFDTVGGTMVAVQENMAKLTAEDREAIAVYLKAVGAVGE